MTAEDPRNGREGPRPSDEVGRLDAARLEETRRVWAALGAYADEPVPPGFADRVMARVRPEAAGTTPLRVLAGGRLRGLAIAASLVASLGAGVLLSQRFLVREAAPVAAPTAALEAVPADLLDNEGLVTLASLPDADFEALLLPDLADTENLDAK